MPKIRTFIFDLDGTLLHTLPDLVEVTNTALEHFGYPTHTARVVPMTPETGIKYYLDENRNYCVPKRSTSEISREL